MRCRTLEQASAPGTEQGVPAKQTAPAKVSQMPGGMPRYGKNLKTDPEFSRGDRLAPAQRLREGCDRLSRRAVHFSRRMGAQFDDAALMVVMMMGDPDCRQAQALTPEQRKHRRSLARINRNDCRAFAQQPDVVILERRDSDDVKHGMIVEETQKMSNSEVDDWLLTPQGRYVMTWEQARVDSLVCDLFGYNALQLGLPQIDFLAQNRIPLRQSVGPCGPVKVRCDFRELPFASNSVDLVMLAHVLEFHADPHQILREVERILIPDGQLVISAFNPLSLWGLWQHMPGRPDGFPANGDYISVLRLRDWLQLLSFEVERGNFGCYAPPFRKRRWLRRCRLMEAAGDRWWSFAGGVYLLRAVKRVRGMHLILPQWKQQKAAAKALTAVTNKEIE